MRMVKPLVALGLAGLALNAYAHKPWLLPSSTLVEAKDPWGDGRCGHFGRAV